MGMVELIKHLRRLIILRRVAFLRDTVPVPLEPSVESALEKDICIELVGR